MSTDKQFTATGDADIGFQTTGNTIGTGVSVTGVLAGVVAAVPTADGTGTIARGQIATSRSPAFNQHAGVWPQATRAQEVAPDTLRTVRPARIATSDS
ncbi:hypothetical protein SAMN05443247_09627 [Bradyrhizobium erythrophlei]|nr:hypothetical protein SAMN05443247_09627 [Bradyrhizobium erythrophlei]